MKGGLENLGFMPSMQKRNIEIRSLSYIFFKKLVDIL